MVEQTSLPELVNQTDVKRCQKMSKLFLLHARLF